MHEYAFICSVCKVTMYCICNCSICGAPRTSVTEEHTSSTLQLATYNENDNSGLSDLDSDVEQYIATDSEARTEELLCVFNVPLTILL